MSEISKENKGNVFTKKGYKEMEQKLDFFISVRRNEIADQIAVARGFGDLSENAEYDEAKKEQAALESQISELEMALRTAIVLDDDAITTDKVGIGTIVKVKDMETEDVEEYSIVGAMENDPYSNKISSESPVGAALIGAKTGDKITVTVPAGNLVYEIIDISRQ